MNLAKKFTKWVVSVPTITIGTSIEELTTGSIFTGRYKVIEELGKGGMGRVYKVLDFLDICGCQNILYFVNI